MLQRHFLGYQTPFLPSLVSYLLERRDTLPETLVITPTSQSSRILREELAASATAILAPAVSTPGSLLHLNDPSIAPKWLEKIAWIETLESISTEEWENYSDLLPNPPDPTEAETDWATSLATEITGLRATLQDHLHNLFSASKFLANTPEEGRWNALANLETIAERILGSWTYQSRSTALRTNFSLPENFTRIILAGITEMPPCLAQALEKFNGELTVLIAAPESEQENFSPLGIPLQNWQERQLPNQVVSQVAADPDQQAAFAIAAIAMSGAPSNQITLGSADDHTGAALIRALSAKGWTAFHPAAQQPIPALARWLRAWKNWLTAPTSKHLATLLTLPEITPLIDGKRAQALLAFNQLRDKHATLGPIPLSESAPPETSSVINTLLALRTKFLSTDFKSAITTHLDSLKLQGESSENQLTHIFEFLETASAVLGKVRRSHSFWLSILIAELPTPSAQPPQNRSIDIQGWLELLFEPGPHLVICGMNEGFIPSRSGGEPWLSENIRKALGLNTDQNRHARDAYLLHSMIEMRRKNGSVNLICGKTGPGGETYLPSRLLLKVPREELVPTVSNLFREIEPPEASLTWESNWKWNTPKLPPLERISVTALPTYLACPFRFYLKHIVKMSVPEPDRSEMNSRDFGSTTHDVLEAWGNDPLARTLESTEKLTKSLHTALEKILLARFGKNPPLAIRIQAESIRNRLAWFAIEQAQIISEGWEILHVERKISIPSGNIIISGKIDRIDRHRETGQIRVIDYKTGKVENIESVHRQKITGSTKIPAHLEGNEPPFLSTTDAKGKPATYFWKNLQLPLYALAESRESDALPIPAYINVGKTRDNVKLTTWDNFEHDDLASAEACVHWISESVAASNFWPPAEKVKYDDFAPLSQKRPLAEAFEKP
ncbi:PD-(D/E)XK nuclease family protein [Luteolibacter sp. AS25]|uniref:PD-(D/E)XK nuclease family protein n=1 Tax=Luteolibacter sp. AS25 TaxID=3135776 RepID=UPI00398B0994